MKNLIQKTDFICGMISHFFNNKKESIRYLKLAADKGDLLSMRNYALMLYEGDGIEINKEEAARYFKLAADEGNLKSIYNYAVMLDNGDGIEMIKKKHVVIIKLQLIKDTLIQCLITHS